jgi:hypothetical protein
MTMYFDDCSRLEDAEGFCLPAGISSSSSKSKAAPAHVHWVKNEKLQALGEFLGYTAQSAKKLEPEQVGEAILQWAMDTNVVDYSEKKQQQQDTPAAGTTSTMPLAKFDSISDLSIAPCTDAIDCLAYFWEQLASLLDHPEAIPANSVHLMVFPNATALWNYDVMLTMMQAVQISKPLLRHEEYTLQLHLFHPDFKHAPKLWSPETHAPFPTAGISLVKKTCHPQPTFQMDATRSKLEALFQKGPATTTPTSGVRPTPTPTLEQVRESCQPWIIQSNLVQRQHEYYPITQPVFLNSNKKHHWFATVWKALSALQPGQSILVVLLGPPASSPDTLMPRFSTWKKWAIVMNAALKRLHRKDDGNTVLQISQVAHPHAPQSHRQSPYPVIQIVCYSNNK